MTESFTQILEEYLKKTKIHPGSIVSGTVISIDKEMVLIDAGLKSESAIPIEQFFNDKNELEIKIGDKIDVALDTIEDGFGETILSREKAKRYESWLILKKSYEEKTLIIGTINGKVKGGFTVELNGVRAFLPGSLVDVRPIKDISHLEGKELEFKVIKLDQKRNNVVVSRRAVIESENNNESNLSLENIKEGMEVKGIVKNITDYGAFIDLGNIDGLLHITDMSWKRVKHPNEIVNIGDEIKVKILKFNYEQSRVSLGLKQLGEDPWDSIKKRFKEGDRIKGRVTNLTDYGCFVEIEEGIEGLVHVSEMDWTNKNIQPSKIVNINDVVEVIILDIDKDRRRISLGIKQCKDNPWKKFAENHSKGDLIKGKIKSITDFGIFIGLYDNIDGLVHISDISWNVSGEEAVRNYKKGDELTAMILQVDVERERISLGIKHMFEDPFNNYIASNKKGTIVHGKITSIDSKIIKVKLSNDVEGHIRYLELSSDNKYKDDKNDNMELKVGDEVEAKLINFDRKNRVVNLSIHNKCETVEKNNNKKGKSNFSNVMMEAFKAATKDE